ncbi:hypothetical protein NO989_04520 [Alteromonas sp. DY56-G5]|uniref:hypothetical protein n=1 Tax=Alteromonas sp. DY56-G5 TaxID=2967128 RepID=UPI00352A4973
MKDETQFSPKQDAEAVSVSDMFNNILNEKIKDGAVEKAIEVKVDEFIKRVADDVFSSWGDLSKLMKEKMTEAIMPTAESLGDIPKYHDFVSKRLKLAAQSFYDDKLVEVLDSELKEIMSEVPDVINLSWLVEKIVDVAREDESEGKISLHINKSYSSYWIAIDKESDKSEYQCDFRIGLREDSKTGKLTIFSLKVDGEDCRKSIALGPFYRFEKILYNAYVTNAEFALDKGQFADDYETEWYYD